MVMTVVLRTGLTLLSIPKLQTIPKQLDLKLIVTEQWLRKHG